MSQAINAVNTPTATMKRILKHNTIPFKQVALIFHPFLVEHTTINDKEYFTIKPTALKFRCSDGIKSIDAQDVKYIDVIHLPRTHKYACQLFDKVDLNGRGYEALIIDNELKQFKNIKYYPWHIINAEKLST